MADLKKDIQTVYHYGIASCGISEQYKKDKDGIYGVFRRYSLHGKILEECKYDDSIKDGWANLYHENQQLKVQTWYKKNLLHGDLKAFSKTGIPILHAVFSYGQLQGKVQCWSLDGNKLCTDKVAEGGLIECLKLLSESFKPTELKDKDKDTNRGKYMSKPYSRYTARYNYPNSYQGIKEIKNTTRRAKNYYYYDSDDYDSMIDQQSYRNYMGMHDNQAHSNTQSHGQNQDQIQNHGQNVDQIQEQTNNDDSSDDRNMNDNIYHNDYDDYYSDIYSTEDRNNSKQDTSINYSLSYRNGKGWKKIDRNTTSTSKSKAKDTSTSQNPMSTPKTGNSNNTENALVKYYAAKGNHSDTSSNFSGDSNDIVEFERDTNTTPKSSELETIDSDNQNAYDSYDESYNAYRSCVKVENYGNRESHGNQGSHGNRENINSDDDLMNLYDIDEELRKL